MGRNLSPASAILALLAGVISIVACQGRAQNASPQVVTVTIRDFKFEPATVTVHEGDTVEWKNEDSALHTATAESQDQKQPAFDSGSISKGAAWRYVAGAKGTYHYTCTFHPYMKGEVIVQ